jgi:hypothetical protein
MTEQIIFATFLIAFGAGLGRALTLRQQYRKTVEGEACLINSKWWVPQVMAASLLHKDQDSTGDLPPPVRVYGYIPPKEPFWLQAATVYQRWRVPRLRRVG